MKLRSIFLIFAATLFSAESWAQSGDFGENNALHWKFSGSFPEATITISGTGAMPSFQAIAPSFQGLAPWFAYANSLNPTDTSPIFPFPAGYPGGFLSWNYNIIIEEGVTSVNFNGSGPGYNEVLKMNISIPSSVTSISIYFSSGSINVASDNMNYSSAGNVLYNKNKSTLIFVPNGNYSNFIIPNGVTSIGGGAFYSCTNLTSITIPSSVTSIGNFALGTINLKTVTVNWSQPLTVDANVFAGIVDIANATLYVPYGTKSRYQADPVWGTFGTIVEQTTTSLKNISNPAFYAFITHNVLKVESPRAEKITIYSAKGTQLYSTTKSAGMIEIPVSSLHGSVLIIKGSVSGTVKIVK